MFRRGTKRPRFSVGGHPVFEHDDSSNHSGLGMPEYDDDSSLHQHPITTSSSDPNFLYSQFIPDRPRRAPKAVTKTPQDNTNLNACLDHLLRTLSRKDKEGFFQYPVTDQFAPGYSQIITRPMDFSTMKKKISQDEYDNILEFRSDFQLMCDNAMKYNRPDTVYWQAAKKLLATGNKLMHKDKLISSRRSLECFARLTERELGFRIDSLHHAADEQANTSTDQLDSSVNDHDNLSSISVSQACSQRKPKLILKLPKFCEKIAAVNPDEEEEEEFSPEEILLQAQQAAQCAREKLSLRPPVCLYTLAYQHKNNTTSLHFVNQDDDSQHTVVLGEAHNPPITESVSRPTISTTLPVITESEKRNQSTPKYFLEHGPFSSNPTMHESTFSSMPKEEVELLIHTYGSEFSAQYAVSLMDYVKNAGDLALAYVDRFLSVLTNGEHDTFVMKKRDKQPKAESIENKPDEPTATNDVQSSASTSTIKQEATTIDQFDGKADDESKLQMPFHETTFDQLTQPVASNDYDLAEKELFSLGDMPSLLNGADQSISSGAAHHNLDVMHNNDLTFDHL